MVPGKSHNMCIERISRAGGWCRARGFTLIELMITLLVVAVLLMIAVPSFKHILASTHLTDVNNGLVGDLAFARTEAVSRGVNVAVAASSGGWGDGWTVEIPAAGTAPGSVPTVLRSHAAVNSGYAVAASTAGNVTFLPQGSLDNAVGICFTISTSNGQNNPPHYLQVLGAGMLKQTTGGTLPTSPNCTAAP